MNSSRVWIFDLDNTLHDATPHIFPHINRAMTTYLQTHLGLDENAAGELRRHYWMRYGATLIGLMRHHGTDPQHFLRETHRFENLDRMVIREPLLRHVLARLPGRKFVFSIEHARYRPKPDCYGFLRLARSNHLRPRRCIMVEDTLDNLRTAKRLGMRTVWVTRAGRVPGFVDVAIRHVGKLPRALARLQ